MALMASEPCTLTKGPQAGVAGLELHVRQNRSTALLPAHPYREVHPEQAKISELR